MLQNKTIRPAIFIADWRHSVFRHILRVSVHKHACLTSTICQFTGTSRPGLRIGSARLVVHGSRTHTQAYPTLSLNSKAMADHDHPRAAVSKLSDSV